MDNEERREQERMVDGWMEGRKERGGWVGWVGWLCEGLVVVVVAGCWGLDQGAWMWLSFWPSLVGINEDGQQWLWAVLQNGDVCVSV